MEIDGGFTVSKIDITAEDKYKVGATGVGLSVPKTNPHQYCKK